MADKEISKSNIPRIYAELPWCPDYDEQNSYRLIRSYTSKPTEVTYSLDLVSSDVIIDQQVRNPSAEDLADFTGRYGDLIAGACRRPDFIDPAQDALFIQTNQYLRRGGLSLTKDGPLYPGIPDCTLGQNLYRVVARQNDDNKKYEIALVHAEARLLPDMNDWASKTSSSFSTNAFTEGESGYCAKRVSNSPIRYALFMARNFDPLGALEQIPQQAGEDGAVLMEEQLKKSLPDFMARCRPTEADTRELNRRMDSIAESYREIFEKKWDPKITEEIAPAQANRILMILGLESFDDRQRQMLSNIVAFGIKHGMKPEHFIPIMSDILKRTGNNERVLYGLATVVSLRVAGALSRAYRKAGLNVPDYDRFTSAVEWAIRRGQISMRVKSLRDTVGYSMAFAYYDPNKNEIAFPPLNPDAPLAMIYEGLIHECYHAYQDINKNTSTILELEHQAYDMGLKASALLTWANISREDQKQMQGSEMLAESERLAKMQIQMALGNMGCMGAGEEVMTGQQTDMRRFLELHLAWSKAAIAEMAKQPGEDSAELFRQFYEIANYVIMNQAYQNYGLLVARHEIEVQRQKDESLSMNSSPKWRTRRADYPLTQTGGITAFRDLERGSLSLGYAYFLDRKAWSAMMLERDNDRSMAGALLYFPMHMDGVE